MDGICTLANDRVYDQLVALLNSIEVNGGKDLPVCVYPYDDNTERIKAEIAQRPNVQLFDNQEIIERWENFAKLIWDSHPQARERWLKSGCTDRYYRMGMHHRFIAFDSPFDRFIYMDGDTLLLDAVDKIFAILDRHDCVVYDFQHKDPTHVYEVSQPKLFEVFSRDRIEREIFCAGFYASKIGLFDENQRDWLIEQLRAGEAEILYPMAPDQTIVNYMMMRSNFSIYNLALQLPKEERTGCCVTSPHFQALDNILYDQGNRLTYIHYIGLSSSLFTRLCSGENLDFPYRDIFLHYRYLYEPSQRPVFTGSPKPYQPPTPTFWQKVTRKLGLGK